MTKCKLDPILGSKQYYRSFVRLVIFRSPGFLFIRSHGFDLLGQLATLVEDFVAFDYRHKNGTKIFNQFVRLTLNETGTLDQNQMTE